MKTVGAFILAMWILGTLVSLAVISALVWVAVHFISKIW